MTPWLVANTLLFVSLCEPLARTPGRSRYLDSFLSGLSCSPYTALASSDRPDIWRKEDSMAHFKPGERVESLVTRRKGTVLIVFSGPFVFVAWDDGKTCMAHRDHVRKVG